MVEQTRLLRELADQLKLAFGSAREDSDRLRREIDELKTAHVAELADLRRTAAAFGQDRIADTIEAAVERALARPRGVTGERE
jgi:hypothetical protein